MEDNIKLEKILKEKGISQKEIANKLKMTPSAINNYIKGKNEPNIKIIKLLAKELDVTTDELLGIEKEPALTEKNNLIKKIDKLTEIECHKLSIFADGLILNRVEQKEKIYKLIKDED